MTKENIKSAIIGYNGISCLVNDDDVEEGTKKHLSVKEILKYSDKLVNEKTVSALVATLLAEFKTCQIICGKSA